MTAYRSDLEAKFGRRAANGEWLPDTPHAYPPVFVWPPRPLAVLKWFPRYVLSWNLVYALIAIGIWLWLTPAVPGSGWSMVGWFVLTLLRNLVLTVAFFGAWHLRLYIRRSQDELFKFHPGWAKPRARNFLFGRQSYENVFWTVASGVPIWTGFECLMLWALKRGHVSALEWPDRAALIIVLMLLVPVFRDPHFYGTHRLLHSRALYRPFHRLHHKNVDPTAWSGLSMHPVEHVLYFSGVLIHFVVPAHPVVILFQLVHAGLAAGTGHVGFAKILVGDERRPRVYDSHTHDHYLHHRYFECNYSDGLFPFDKWFHTYLDGSAASIEAMKSQRARRLSAARAAREQQA